MDGKQDAAMSKRIVWKIFRFEQRYELADDVRFARERPLVFVRDYVGSGTDDESIRTGQQMMALMQRPAALELRGAFTILREMAANRSRMYRGYLLDENLGPADTRKIALWLGVDVRKAGRILRELGPDGVGLLEKAAMPAFSEPPRPTRKRRTESGGKAAGRAAKKAAQKGRGGARKAAMSQSTPCADGREKAVLGQSAKKISCSHEMPLNNKHQHQTKTQTGKSGTAGKPANKKPETGKTRTRADVREEIEALATLIETAASGQPEPKPERKPEPEEATGQTPGCPTTTHAATRTEPEARPDPRMNPTEPDAAGEAQNPRRGLRAVGPGMDRPARHVPLDQACTRDAEAFKFALEVYRVLGIQPRADSCAESEVAAFCEAWKRAVAYGLNDGELRELWSAVMKSAAGLRRKVERGVVFHKSPQAVLMWQFDRRLVAWRRSSLGCTA